MPRCARCAHRIAARRATLQQSAPCCSTCAMLRAASQPCHSIAVLGAPCRCAYRSGQCTSHVVGRAAAQCAISRTVLQSGTLDCMTYCSPQRTYRAACCRTRVDLECTPPSHHAGTPPPHPRHSPRHSPCTPIHPPPPPIPLIPSRKVRAVRGAQAEDSAARSTSPRLGPSGGNHSVPTLIPGGGHGAAWWPAGARGRVRDLRVVPLDGHERRRHPAGMGPASEQGRLRGRERERGTARRDSRRLPTLHRPPPHSPPPTDGVWPE